MPYLCSVHQQSGPYKRDLRNVALWRAKVDTMALRFYQGAERPWISFSGEPFREWLSQWFPHIAARYPQTDAVALLIALDDSEAPATARARHHTWMLTLARRIVVFLTEAECWLDLYAAPRRRPRGPRQRVV